MVTRLQLVCVRSTIQGSVPTVQSLAASLRPQLPSAWALEGVKRGAVALSRERRLHAHVVASHAACTGSGRGICEKWQEERGVAQRGDEKGGEEEENAGEPVSSPRTP